MITRKVCINSHAQSEGDFPDNRIFLVRPDHPVSVGDPSPKSGVLMDSGEPTLIVIGAAASDASLAKLADTFAHVPLSDLRAARAEMKP